MGAFDRFASAASTFVSRAPFFTFSVLIVVAWAPTLLVLNLNTSQLIINTVTTIGTWLLVALLQNAQERFEKSVHAKLDALARHAVGDMTDAELRRHVGIEEDVAA